MANSSGVMIGQKKTSSTGKTTQSWHCGSMKETEHPIGSPVIPVGVSRCAGCGDLINKRNATYWKGQQWHFKCI